MSSALPRCGGTGRVRHPTRDSAVVARTRLLGPTPGEVVWVVGCTSCRGHHLYTPGDPNTAWLQLPSPALTARARARSARLAAARLPLRSEAPARRGTRRSAKSPTSAARSATLDPTSPAP